MRQYSHRNRARRLTKRRGLGRNHSWLDALATIYELAIRGFGTGDIAALRLLWGRRECIEKGLHRGPRDECAPAHATAHQASSTHPVLDRLQAHADQARGLTGGHVAG